MSGIGNRLRELRENRNLTLKQVADGTELSVSFLSLVERDKVSISVDNLERLARFYAVRMVHFFHGADELPVFVTRRMQIKERIDKITDKQSAFLLLANRSDACMEPLLVKIGPGHGDPHFRSYEGETLMYVVQGSVRLLSEKNEMIELHSGETAYYFGFPGHRIETISPAASALMLLVTTPPTSFRDDVADAQRGVFIQSEER